MEYRREGEGERRSLFPPLSLLQFLALPSRPFSYFALPHLADLLCPRYKNLIQMRLTKVSVVFSVKPYWENRELGKILVYFKQEHAVTRIHNKFLPDQVYQRDWREILLFIPPCLKIFKSRLKRKSRCWTEPAFKHSWILPGFPEISWELETGSRHW